MVKRKRKSALLHCETCGNVERLWLNHCRACTDPEVITYQNKIQELEKKIELLEKQLCNIYPIETVCEKCDGKAEDPGPFIVKTELISLHPKVLAWIQDEKTEETPFHQVRWLWEQDRWDGRTKGIVYDKDTGKHSYAVAYREEREFDAHYDMVRSKRYFALYALDEERYNYEKKWHKLFEEHVGMHTTYGPDEKLLENRYTHPIGGGPDATKFYKPYKKRYKKLALGTMEITGWCYDE